MVRKGRTLSFIIREKFSLVRVQSLFMWGGGGLGEESWGVPGLFFLEKMCGPKENFMMVGGGSLCVL